MTHEVPIIDALPLHTGERLTREEFHRRYAAHPAIKRAELIAGVVYVASPAHYQQHGRLNRLLAGWLSLYEAMTPGVTGADNATLQLDNANEIQPDALLRIDTALGGRSSITSDDYLAGAPELVVEVAASSVGHDLHSKRYVYERNGIQEYLVVQSYTQRVTWLVLRNGQYAPLLPDERDILRSEVFRGLWLLPAALWAGASGNMTALLAVLQEGLASAEHAAFVAGLQKK